MKPLQRPGGPLGELLAELAGTAVGRMTHDDRRQAGASQGAARFLADGADRLDLRAEGQEVPRKG